MPVDPAGIITPVIEMGLMLARDLHASVHFVSIIDKSIGLAAAGTGMISQDQLEKELEGITNQLNKIKNENKDLKIEITTLIGSPNEDILDHISKTGTSFIVLGTLGRSGFTRFLMGSTAEYLVRHSIVPVVVVPFNRPTH